MKHKTVDWQEQITSGIICKLFALHSASDRYSYKHLSSFNVVKSNPIKSNNLFHMAAINGGLKHKQKMTANVKL